MQITIDLKTKAIKIDSNLSLSEMVTLLDSLLPEGSPNGHWKEYILINQENIEETLNKYYQAEPSPTYRGTGWNNHILGIYNNTTTASNPTTGIIGEISHDTASIPSIK